MILEVLKNLPKDTIIIEGEARGADQIAGEIASELGLLVEKFPANWQRHGRKAGHIRNAQMLCEGKPTEVIAFHEDWANSRGTRNMITISLEANLPVTLYNTTGLAPLL
jgi:hypothetical protein